jgi:predicted dehydrogenase
VYTKEVQEMNIAAEKSGKVFSMMYNQRTNPYFQKERDLIQTGELGKIRRTNWINTHWYRSQSYYNSNSWRGTWAGEGGGVLINQSLHQLDLWQWITWIMPTRMRAFCQFGKYRDIEVEDDVTAYAEYGNGASGVFINTIGEVPGTNRLEITGDCGKVVLENGKLQFWRLRVPETQFNLEFKGTFGAPDCWRIEVPVTGEDTGHRSIICNFVTAISKGTPLLAPGEEGIRALALANAMHLSTWIDVWVQFPIDQELYYSYLQKRINAK